MIIVKCFAWMMPERDRKDQYRLGNTMIPLCYFTVASWLPNLVPTTLKK